MRKLTLTLILSLIVLALSAQSNETPERLKYTVLAPDGSIALTIVDDSRDDKIQLEAVNSFYKYELIDPMTSKLVFTAANKGTVGAFDKAKVSEGTYDLRVYTRSFIILSKIKVSAPPLSVVASNETVVINN